MSLENVALWIMAISSCLPKHTGNEKLKAELKERKTTKNIPRENTFSVWFYLVRVFQCLQIILVLDFCRVRIQL